MFSLLFTSGRVPVVVSGTIIFTTPCYSNGAVLPSYDVRPSVTLMDPDHIR